MLPLQQMRLLMRLKRDTVTADDVRVSDVDGSGILSTTFQWFAADDAGKANAADISGATDAAYTIPADGTLNGKHLFIKVTDR